MRRARQVLKELRVHRALPVHRAQQVRLGPSVQPGRWVQVARVRRDQPVLRVPSDRRVWRDQSDPPERRVLLELLARSAQQATLAQSDQPVHRVLTAPPDQRGTSVRLALKVQRARWVTRVLPVPQDRREPRVNKGRKAFRVRRVFRACRSCCTTQRLRRERLQLRAKLCRPRERARPDNLRRVADMSSTPLEEHLRCSIHRPFAT